MICPTCKTIHHTCPECGRKAIYTHWNKKSIRLSCGWHNWHQDKKGNVIKVKVGRPRMEA